jgi:hypothetical protein
MLYIFASLDRRGDLSRQICRNNQSDSKTGDNKKEMVFLIDAKWMNCLCGKGWLLPDIIDEIVAN